MGFTGQGTGTQQLPHLHVFLLQHRGFLGENLIGLDTLQALMALLLLPTKDHLPYEHQSDSRVEY